MIVEFTEPHAAPNWRKRFQGNPWTEEIDVSFNDCDDTEEVEKPDYEPSRSGSDVKVDVPLPANSKALFLEAARLRNKDSHQFGKVGVQIPNAAPDRTANYDQNAKLTELIEEIRALQAGDRDVLQRFLKTLDGHTFAHPKVETVLETFNGVLNCIDGDTASLTLTSTANGRVYYAQYPAEKFAEKGIEEEDRFICKTVESAGGTRIEIEAIPYVELTDEHIRAIREKINKVLPPHDPGVRY